MCLLLYLVLDVGLNEENISSNSESYGESSPERARCAVITRTTPAGA